MIAAHALHALICFNPTAHYQVAFLVDSERDRTIISVPLAAHGGFKMRFPEPIPVRGEALLSPSSDKVWCAVNPPGAAYDHFRP